MELSRFLRQHARTVAGKEQLLMDCLARALEVIPRQLCDNAGFDSTNILNKLRHTHAQGKWKLRGVTREYINILYFSVLYGMNNLKSA